MTEETKMLSSEDQERVSVYQLGKVIRVYRIKREIIRWFQIGGFAILLVSLLVLLLALTPPPGVYGKASLVAALGGCIAGGFVLLIGIPQEQSTRLLLCEEGFVQMRRRIWQDQIEVVYWKDLHSNSGTLERGAYFLEYDVSPLQENKRIGIFRSYQDFDDLIGKIQEHMIQHQK